MITCRDRKFYDINTWFRVQNQISEAGNPLNMPMKISGLFFLREKTGLLDLKKYQAS